MPANETPRRADARPKPKPQTRDAEIEPAASPSSTAEEARDALREQRSAWPEWRKFPPMSRPIY